MPKKPDKPGWPLIGRAMCHNCMAAFADGRADCKVTCCPLYAKMPYRKLEPDMSWMEINPRKNGYVAWDGEELNEPPRRYSVNVTASGTAEAEETDWGGWGAVDEIEEITADDPIKEKEITNVPLQWGEE